MNDSSPAHPAKLCPLSGKPAEARFRPFCSRRCADVDLNRWLSGSYAVPVVEEDGSDAEADDAGVHARKDAG